MATNEATTFTDGNIQTGREKKNDQQQEMGWQSVTIGGVTGILMGAGAMYALDSYGNAPVAEEAANNNGAGSDGKAEVHSHAASNGLQVAEVDQNLTFGEAFAAARTAVGPGGVFHWHGNIYNTYTADEWNSMSAGDRAQFAQQVQPEIRPSEMHQDHKQDVAQHQEPHQKVDEPIKETPEETQTEPSKPVTENPESQNDDGETHFLGFENITIDGQEHLAGHATNEGRHVYFVDLDNDSEHLIDHAITDRNGDGVLTIGEAVEFGGKVTMEEFGLLSQIESANANASSGQVALNTQDDIATDMPDYMSDANTVL